MIEIHLTAFFYVGPLAGIETSTTVRFDTRDAAARWLREQRRLNRIKPQRGTIVSFTSHNIDTKPTNQANP
jgi:hypothetical protein